MAELSDGAALGLVPILGSLRWFWHLSKLQHLLHIFAHSRLSTTTSTLPNEAEINSFFNLV